MKGENQKTILLVEDEAIIAMAGKMTLEKLGYGVIIANSGEQAVAAVDKNPVIDLILMDINLGAGMDGTEAASLILKDRDLPVVFLSSHAEPEVVEKTEKITSYGYVLKGSSATVLDASIKMAFKLFTAKEKEEEKEAALRKSEEEYRTLFRVMLDGFALHKIICDDAGAPVDYRFLAVNPAFERMTGLKAAQLIGRTVLEVMPGTERHWIDTYGKVALSGSPALFENYSSELDKYFKVTAFQPVPGQFACIFVDITETKLAEEALKKSQLLLRSSIESPKDMIILSIDGQYRYLYFNSFHKEVMAAVYGKHVELGMNLLECITCDDDRLKAKINYDRALAGESHSTIEEYGDLIRQCYETRYNPIVNDRNEVIGATAFSADVSVRKRAEAALLESEARFRTLYENSTLGLYRTTPDGRIQLANPALVKMLGYSSFAELAARNLEQSGFAPSSERAHFIKTIEKDSEIKGLEYAWKRSDGTTIVVRESARAIRDARGNTLFYDGIVEDVTEIKRSEKLAETLYGISQAIYSTDDFDELFRRIHGLIAGIVPAENFFIALLTDGDRSLAFPYFRDEKDVDDHSLIRADNPDSLTAEVLRTKKPLLLNEAQMLNRDATGLDRGLGTSPKCWLGVPLQIGNETIGVMAIQDYHDSGAYSQRDVMLLESTAGQIAIAIDRKRAEKALRESVASFKGYFNMGTVGMCVTSLEKGWIEVNDCLCRMLGYSRDELMRLTWDEMTHPDDLNSDLDLFNQVLAGKRDSYELEKRFMRKDGQVMHALLYVTCQRHPDGSVHLFLASLVDISERKRAEDEIRRQLSEKEILLKEVHHRIKNNIASIGGLLSLRVQATTNPEAIAVLQDAIGRVDSMRILYEKLMLNEAYKDVSVKTYAESLLDLVISLFLGGPRILLDKRIDDFQLDSKRLFPLGIIINELLTNILKYAFSGRDSGSIRFSLVRANGRVTLTLHDDGVGLPAGFDLDQSKGFGLMLVKMLSQQLDGVFSIAAQSGTRCQLEFNA